MTRIIPAQAAEQARAEAAEYRRFRCLSQELIEASDALSGARLRAGSGSGRDTAAAAAGAGKTGVSRGRNGAASTPPNAASSSATAPPGSGIWPASSFQAPPKSSTSTMPSSICPTWPRPSTVPAPTAPTPGPGSGRTSWTPDGYARSWPNCGPIPRPPTPRAGASTTWSQPPPDALSAVPRPGACASPRAPLTKVVRRRRAWQAPDGGGHQDLIAHRQAKPAHEGWIRAPGGAKQRPPRPRSRMKRTAQCRLADGL